MSSRSAIPTLAVKMHRGYLVRRLRWPPSSIWSEGLVPERQQADMPAFHDEPAGRSHEVALRPNMVGRLLRALGDKASVLLRRPARSGQRRLYALAHLAIAD
jgi:hypothetical protein